MPRARCVARPQLAAARRIAPFVMEEAAAAEATPVEEWEIVAGFAPRRFREDLTPEAVRQAWTDGPESAALRKARDLLEAGLEGPLFMDAHSATLVLSGDRAAHLEREGARWLLVDF